MQMNDLFFIICIVFLIILFAIGISHKFIFVSALASLFGLIFAGLKYKLDRANYKKSLFEKRYLIFQTCDEVLYGFFHRENRDAWRILGKKLDSIQWTPCLDHFQVKFRSEFKIQPLTC